MAKPLGDVEAKSQGEGEGKLWNMDQKLDRSKPSESAVCVTRRLARTNLWMFIPCRYYLVMNCRSVWSCKRKVSAKGGRDRRKVDSEPLQDAQDFLPTGYLATSLSCLAMG